MEKKLPEDNLERFLRSSFEDFEQKPSDKLWGKIDAGLENKPGFYKRIKPWMYWTAAASVLGAIILLQFKSNQTLNQQLEAVLEQNQRLSQQTGEIKVNSDSVQYKIDHHDELNKTSEGDLKSTVAMKDLPAFSDQSKESAPVAENKLKPDGASLDSRKNETVVNDNKKVDGNKEKNKAQAISETQNKLKINQNSEENQQLSADKIRKIKGQNNLAKESTAKDRDRSKQESVAHLKQPSGQQTNAPVNEPDAIAGNEKEANDNIVLNENNTSKREDYAVTVLDDHLSLVKSTESKQLNYSKLTVDLIPVNLKQDKKSGYELALVGGTLHESGEIKPKRFFDPRVMDFPKNKYSSVNSWTAGLEATNYLTNNLMLSSGVSVKHFEFKNALTQSLAFKNREQPNPGNLPFQHDFRCKIPGPTGTSDIIINSEQLDSRASISDAEEVKITIKNQSKLNYLTLPLSIGYQVNKGNWSVFAKTGIQADVFLSRTVDEPQITLSHPQLQLRKDRPNNRPTMALHHANSLVLNGTLAAGIKYQFNPQWSVSLNPGLILPFTQREYNPNIQVDSKIYSLQLGVSYSLSSL